MPIPPMLASPATLPPFVGTDPTLAAARSPYSSSMIEVAQRFGTSPRRREILTGLLQYRDELRRVGIGVAFQWLAGSFVENPGREPNDVDVVTFYAATLQELQTLQHADPARWQWAKQLANPQFTKPHFHYDGYMVNILGDGRALVGGTHYWYGLFSHQRASLAWKGMIQVEFSDPNDDVSAQDLVASMVP